MSVDIFCEWNSAFQLSANGTLAGADGWDRIRQRIVRSILTNSSQTLPSGTYTAADYLYDNAYGIGAGAMVDESFSKSFTLELKKRITAAIITDAAVDTTYKPAITITKQANAILISARIKLNLLPDPQTIEVSF